MNIWWWIGTCIFIILYPLLYDSLPGEMKLFGSIYFNTMGSRITWWVASFLILNLITIGIVVSSGEDKD